MARRLVRLPFDVTIRLDSKNVLREMSARQDAHFLGQRELVRSLVADVQRVSDPEELVVLHARLLAQYAARQSVRVERRDERGVEGAALQDLVTRRPKPLDDIRRLQTRREMRDDQDIRDAVFLHLLRRIADALVWRLTDFDRAGLTVMGDGDRVDRLAQGSGFGEELATIDAVWEVERAVAVHNDLPTCLRFGDITVFRPPLPTRTIEIGEVKVEGQRTGHLEQSARLENRLQVLREGEDVRPDGQRVRIRRLPIPYRTHLERLAEVVAEARRHGRAEAMPEAGMLVVAVDLAHYSDSATGLGDWMQDPPRRLGWAPETDRYLGASALVASMLDRRRNTGYLAPLPLVPLPTGDIADLLLGTVDYVVTLDARAIERAFAERGITARLAGAGEADRLFLRAERNGLVVEVGSQVREQMLRELTTSECLIDMVAAYLDELAPGAAADHHWMVFCDERDAWPGSLRLGR